MGRSERALGLVLACRKELPLLLRAGRWDPDGKQRGSLLHGARVLLAGTSDVDALARLLGPTGAHVVRPAAPDRPTRDEVAAADVLVLLPGAAPLAEDVLAALPAGASLVDIAAPNAVDVDALAAGLAAGTPLHAALVLGPGGLGPEHPLWRSPRALLVPEEDVA